MTSRTSQRPCRDRVLIGVNESEESLSALRWAAEFVAASGSDLHVVYAWFGKRSLGRKLFGSVSQQLARDTTCPTIIVPGPFH